MVDISVIIVNRNVRQYLEECLASVFQCWEGPSEALQVVVVDNGSTDGSGQMLKEKFPSATLIANRKNLGFAAACNQGIAISRGSYLMLLNPDTIMADGLFTGLISFMEAHPKAGMAGPLVLNPDGTKQPTYRRFPTYANIIFSRKSPISRLWPGNKASREYLQGGLQLDRPGRVESLGGVCMLLRREMLDQVGCLDEGFFMYLEDTDLCYRAAAKGWECWLVPSARLIHHWGGSSRQEAARAADQHRRSLYYYFLKHHNPSFIQKSYLKACLSIHKFFDGERH
jgi:hypothetical protein